VSVSGDQRGIEKGNIESLWDEGGCVQKSVSGDQREILKVYGMRGVHAKVRLRRSKGNLESVWYAGGACKSQSPDNLDPRLNKKPTHKHS